MSARPEFKGDYMGFKYNGKHSSELGIVRTSDGSRFNENLLPTIQDKTVQVPGGDGTYFFGSYYTQRQFSIPFAFDGLTEDEVRELRSHFGDKKIHDLVFDESPYKTYRAKVTGTATIKHIVFDDSTKEGRIYKGEGTIQFTCYQPYAICSNKWLEQYSNYSQWREASGLVSKNEGYDTWVGNSMRLYNPGDKESDFCFGIYFIDSSIPAGYIKIDDAPDGIRQLWWNEIKRKGQDTKIVINSKLNLIEGYEGNYKSGNVYNKDIFGGEFFTIPMGESTLKIDESCLDKPRAIDYNYYYL